MRFFISKDAAEPSIHEAELASGPSGAVIGGNIISKEEAIERRKDGKDVVICGEETKANRRLARDVESAVGPYKREDPHPKAGPNALPHFQADVRPPEGHTFYETSRRKAWK